LVEAAIEEGADTILTCDNGIAAADALKRAKENGLTVIVTDHHEIPFCEENGERKEILPDADAIVNPKQKDCAYPFKEICGAVVAWHLIRVLYDMTGKGMEQADVFIENAAFATIGDVMELQHENRILVKEGLKRLNQTKSIGMRSLIASNKLDLGGIKAYHIGFVLGPCLNASGRLDTAKKALLLLKTKDEVDAGKLAEELVELNTSRKALTEKGIEDAMQCIETQGLSEDRVLVIYLPDCHESIAGIIAGRVRERYHRPVYVLTNAKEGVKGSGRSIEGYSMYEELCKCQDLLDKFGGHPMAAGCSMQRENVDIFRKRLNDRCTLTKKDLQPKIRIDVPMTLEYLTEELIHEFAVLEPFGKGNEKPVFADKELRVRDIRIVGTNRKFVRMKLVNKRQESYPAICFEGDAYENQKYLEEHKDNLAVVYYPQINTFFGEAQIEVLITHFR
jgi:single-stranded-DNA-specific exonuclease